MKKKRKPRQIHYIHCPNFVSRINNGMIQTTLCGKVAHEDSMVDEETKRTDKQEDVTCKNCLMLLEQTENNGTIV